MPSNRCWGVVCVGRGWCAWLMNGMDSFFRDTTGEPPGKLLAQRIASIHFPLSFSSFTGWRGQTARRKQEGFPPAREASCFWRQWWDNASCQTYSDMQKCVATWRHSCIYQPIFFSPEDTVVAVSVTGILKVWIITSEVSRMQVSKGFWISDISPKS